MLECAASYPAGFFKIEGLISAIETAAKSLFNGMCVDETL